MLSFNDEFCGVINVLETSDLATVQLRAQTVTAEHGLLQKWYTGQAVRVTQFPIL
jgi:hypothetical protein